MEILKHKPRPRDLAPDFTTLDGVRRIYMARWREAPLVRHEDPALYHGIKYSRVCPFCESTISWQGWPPDSIENAIKMGEVHWRHHAARATNDPVSFWAEGLRFTGLVPVSASAFFRSTGSSIYDYRKMPIGTHPVFNYPAGYIAVWAVENIKLLKSAGLRIYKRGALYLMHNADWQYLSYLYTADAGFELAAATYRDMARSRRKETAP